MKILVTGAAGFIGSNLCVRLLKEGHRVSGVDNFSYGKIDNIKTLFKNDNFYFAKEDIREKSMKSHIEHTDLIIHLAAHKIPRYGNTLEALHSNSLGTYNLLELNKEKRSPFILVSTSDVYGKTPKIPFNEGDDLVIGSPDHRRWAYAVSKMYDEHLVIAYHEEYEMDYNIVRFFNVYGINCALDWTGGVVPQIIGAVLRGDPVTIHGNGKQKRCYCFIDDIIDGIMALIEKGVRNEMFNFGHTEMQSVNELVDLIYSLCGVFVEDKNIKYIPYKQFFGKYEDVKIRQPDISKAKKSLDWSPTVSLIEGLQKTIEWQRKRK